MRAIRTIFTALACLIIAVGIFSVVGYELYFRHADPTPVTQPATQDDSATPDEPEPTPEPEQTPEPEPQDTEPSAQELRAKELLEDMTLDQKLYQMFFVTPESLTDVTAATRAGDATKEALLANPVGGLLYAEKNLEDTAQVKELLSGTQKIFSEGNLIPAFLAIDEEGGDVAPVSSALDTTSFHSMAEIGQSGDPSTANEMGKTIGKELSELGFNVNFAPIADLADSTHNNLIGSRSFGTDAAVTSTMVASVISGTQEQGVLNAVSHFPGLGSLNDVAHISCTALNRSVEELQEEEFLPFEAAVAQKAGFIIVSHAVLSALDDQRPCSMSPSVMILLREQLGYQGLIMTDMLSLPAITERYSAADAAVNAVTAGADILLCPEDLDAAIEALRKAVETQKIDESQIDKSVVRILTAKLTLGLIE